VRQPAYQRVHHQPVGKGNRRKYLFTIVIVKSLFGEKRLPGMLARSILIGGYREDGGMVHQRLR
jgi:hypothetical protein